MSTVVDRSVTAFGSAESVHNHLSFAKAKTLAWTRRRKWPLLSTALVVAGGMMFMFLWTPLVIHNNSWDIGDDTWGIFRAAHYVGWGYLGGIYTPDNGVNSFPGMPILLAPVAMLSSSLHLTESYSPYILAHPTAALLLQPTELFLASTVLFAGDSLAERMNVSSNRRIALCATIMVLAWPVAAVWGHAEDVLALTFAIYAIIALFDGRFAAAGWFLGFGILLQPYVGLLLPLLVGATPHGRRLGVTVRSVILSVVLVGVSFVGDPSDTYRSLVEQPTSPSINHATPWVSLAPVVGKIGGGSGTSSYRRAVSMEHEAFGFGTQAFQRMTLVAGGPGRMIDLVLAVIVGLYVWRRQQSREQFLWLAACLLASRCLFEAVMTPYYLTPPLILFVVVTAWKRGARFWMTCAIALGVTPFSYYHLGPWSWWLPILLVLVVAAVLALPPRVCHSIDGAERAVTSVSNASDGPVPAGELATFSSTRADAPGSLIAVRV